MEQIGINRRFGDEHLKYRDEMPGKLLIKHEKAVQIL